MNSNFSTPSSSAGRNASLTRSAATKRDSLQAELDRDPQLSSAKRQQRSQVLTSHMAHASLERQLLTTQATKAELETKLREKDLLIERLERDRRWLSERESEEQEEKLRERTEFEEKKRNSDTELRSVRSALASLKEEHADLEDAHASLSRSTTQTIASQKSEISTLKRKVALVEDELRECKLIAEERSKTIQDIQEQLDELVAAQDHATRANMEDENWTVVREELHRQANHLRTVESTNMKLTTELTILRERNTSLEVLREEKRGLERRLSTMDELREKVVRLEAELEASRREREQWANKAQQSSSASHTPISVTQSLSSLRLEHARLLEDHGANLALLHSREVEVKRLEERDADARTTIDKLQAEIRLYKDKIGRAEQRVILAEREVGFLQALQTSYRAEEATLDGAVIDEAKAKRSQELEKLVEDYKAVNRELEKEIDALGGRAGTLGQGRTREELAAEIDSERAAKAEALRVQRLSEAESEKHLEKIEELEQTLFELRGEIASGNHVPPGIRVLSLKNNPAQEWADLRQAVVDRLKAENEALIDRLKELEANGAISGLHSQNQEQGTNAAKLVPRESWEVVIKEKIELEEIVKQKEKRLLRLQQVFTAKSAEFREAIASILGLKLAFYPNGQVRVTSMYDLSASFVFQPTKTSGEGAIMQLIAQGEGGPQDLPQLMHYWVEQEQCIPCFLASVTLECYEKSKTGGKDHDGS